MKMARIEISLPGEFAFFTNIPIRTSDINRGGHLGHDRILLILEEARTQFWNSLGYSLEGDKKISHIIVDAAIIYKKQAYYGQTLKVGIAVTDLTSRGFDLVYRVSDANSGTEIARAKTGILIYDYQKQKVTMVPGELRNKLAG